MQANRSLAQVQCSGEFQRANTLVTLYLMDDEQTVAPSYNVNSYSTVLSSDYAVLSLGNPSAQVSDFAVTGFPYRRVKGE